MSNTENKLRIELRRLNWEISQNETPELLAEREEVLKALRGLGAGGGTLEVATESGPLLPPPAVPCDPSLDFTAMDYRSAEIGGRW